MSLTHTRTQTITHTHTSTLTLTRPDRLPQPVVIFDFDRSLAMEDSDAHTLNSLDPQLLEKVPVSLLTHTHTNGSAMNETALFCVCTVPSTNTALCRF